MRRLTYLLLLLSFDSSADFFIEPRIQGNISHPIDSNFSLSERSVYVGAYSTFDMHEYYFTFDGEYRYDTVYNSKYSKQAKDRYRSYGWIHEFYVEKKIQSFDFFLGYQKVVWGQADELRVVDVINPLDYRQFILQDLNDYMIAQPMLRVNSNYFDNWQIEGIWLFKFQPNKYPPYGSQFYIDSFPDTKKEKPKKSEFGLSGTSNYLGTDIGLYLFNGFSDDPIYRDDIESITATHPKEKMLGVSASRPIDKFIIRTELAYFPDKEYMNEDLTSNKHDMVKGLIGVDYLYKDWMISVQAMDRYINSWDRSLFETKSDPYYTFSIEGKTMADKLSIRFANTYNDSNGGGNLLQTKLKYKYDDNLSFSVFVDVINGSKRNFMGSKSDSDRVFYSIVYRY